MSLRCPDELAREILRSTLAIISDVYSRPGAHPSTVAAAAEGRLAAAMIVAECPELLRDLFDLRMAAACASGTAVASEQMAEWREGYAWAMRGPSVVRAGQVAA